MVANLDLQAGQPVRVIQIVPGDLQTTRSETRQ